MVVATPNTSHFAIALRAIAAGKHCVVDKPFTLTAAEGEALRHDVVLSAFHNRRWDGDFLTLRDLLRGGALGHVVEIVSRFDRFRPALSPGAWREQNEPGAGLVWDLAPHLLDQALVLFGEPQALQCWMVSERGGAVVDDAFGVRLQYGSCAVWLGANVLAAAPGPRWYIRGTNGSYTKFGLDPQEAALRSGRYYDSDRWGEEDSSCWGEMRIVDAKGQLQTGTVETRAGDYREFYRGFARAVRNNAVPAVTADDAIRVIRLIELARDSNRLRCEVVCT